MLVRPTSHSESLDALLRAQRLAATAAPDLRQREAHLRRLERLVVTNASALSRAVSADFGHRSMHETQLLEIFPTLAAARHARRRLARWMAPQRRALAPYFFPARARTVWEPLGVIGIIAPWNYPVLLALQPLIAALAAGNRAMIKMSELAPNTGHLLQALVTEAFAEDHVRVVNGGVEVAKRFAALAFDHLLFTGSTETGRSVMRTAAQHLTPLTLELGGKSPAIVGPGADVERAARRIVSAKCRNAGQSCIAPDYALLQPGALAPFIAAARRSVGERYPVAGGPDYSQVASDAHAQRLAALLADAVERGASVIPLRAGTSGRRDVVPAVVTNVNDEMRIMREEIFGPLLPLRTYGTLDEALAYVNARPRPLALYYFDTDRAAIATVVGGTTSGGVCINDVMLQFAADELPFGGVGASGFGAYHGRAGFERFSHQKSIFEQRFPNGIGLFEPPYGRRFEFLLRLLQR